MMTFHLKTHFSRSLFDCDAFSEADTCGCLFMNHIEGDSHDRLFKLLLFILSWVVLFLWHSEWVILTLYSILVLHIYHLFLYLSELIAALEVKERRSIRYSHGFSHINAIIFVLIGFIFLVWVIRGVLVLLDALYRLDLNMFLNDATTRRLHHTIDYCFLIRTNFDWLEFVEVFVYWLAHFGSGLSNYHSLIIEGSLVRHLMIRRHLRLLRK